jgi:hypothetical protein
LQRIVYLQSSSATATATARVPDRSNTYIIFRRKSTMEKAFEKAIWFVMVDYAWAYGISISL